MPGRNDPCPCGSGKKYKKCHLSVDEEARAGHRPEGSSATHGLDENLVMQILEFGKRYYEAQLFEWLDELMDGREEDYLQFGIPWVVYEAPFRENNEPQGRQRRLVDLFLDRRRSRLLARERDWLDAQRRSWLSVWEVTGIEPGASLDLHDLLSGEMRHIREISASRGARMRSVMFVRVVDFESESLLCGVYPRILRPRDGEMVVAEIRHSLEVRRGKVSIDRLREFDTVLQMLDIWEDVLDQAVERASTPPELTNSDGDPILFTTDHTKIPPSDRATIEERIEILDGMNREEDEGTTVFVRTNEENTVTGTVRIDDRRIRLETNSIERADVLRETVDAALGKLAGRWVREHTDPFAPHEGPGLAEPSTIPSEEAAGVIRQMKNEHYDKWLEEKIPGLGGKTPLEAATTSSGRRDLESILKDIEFIESDHPENQRFDVSTLRRRLGM